MQYTAVMIAFISSKICYSESSPLHLSKKYSNEKDFVSIRDAYSCFRNVE